LDAEPFDIPAATAAAVNAAHASARPVVAVGTTVVRALEAAVRAGRGEVRPGPDVTNLFLLPGDRFSIVTDLITNFHLPRSTLLMLVCAFAGRQVVLDAYHAAIAAGYRFYSYGDAMLITGRPHA
jgi:S-adenosylmethionine:tRNA ribosyltransferase-isomerase